ncbi:serine hydrolase domain-containing protein [Halalkalibaculum sp. DA3122]|uniref:serine hydrolase domain-containing protein n=1 Tax=Halalkalibaculum sp. DA3122 TaxID=3373607 RepID=UPI0037545D79
MKLHDFIQHTREKPGLTPSFKFLLWPEDGYHINEKQEAAEKLCPLRVLWAILIVPAVFIFSACSDTVNQQSREAVSISAVDSLVDRAVAQEHIPGAVVRVQQGDSILHHKAYGYAQLYTFELERLEQPDTMTTGHLFDLASLTKVSATTFGIMLLADSERIQLDSPVHRWLPEFARGDKKKITVRHLLRHTAGLPQWVPTYYYASNAEEQYDYIASLPLKYEVGAERHYSDLGFMLLGEITRRVSGQPLDQFLEQELYRPLDLKHTGFNPLESGISREKIAATSHGNPFEKQMVYDDDFGYSVDVEPESWNGWRLYTLRGEVNDGNAWYGAGGVAGHAGLFSTAAELQSLVHLLLRKGKYQGRQLISEAAINTFLTIDQFGNGLGWAMDPAVFSAEGVPKGSFGHTGFTGTSILAIPEYDLSVILFTNRQHAGRRENGYYIDLGPLRQQIATAVLKKIGHQSPSRSLQGNPG